MRCVTPSRSVARINNWVLSLLFIFTIAFVGVGISIFTRTSIPFWIFFVFSLIYSVEKWFYYQTRKHKSIGKIYRLFLNLSILYLLGLIIWSGIRLFSQQLIHSPLADSLMFLAEFVFFIWMWRVVAKNSWRWPSMKLTALSIILVSVVFAFAGVEPMTSYKGVVWNKLTMFLESVDNFTTAENREELLQEDDTTLISDSGYPLFTPTPYSVPTFPALVTPTITPTQDLKNPSWEELKAFLLEDDTDKMEYVYPTTVCADFARKLQNNAKEAGWRCAFVDVQLDGYPDWYELGIPSYTGHACNAFETTDRGLIYIDCTNSIGTGPRHGDCIVDVRAGRNYLPRFIFPTDWESKSMGKIVAINTTQW